MLQKKVCIYCKTLSHCERIQKQQQQKITKKKTHLKTRHEGRPILLLKEIVGNLLKQYN